MSVSVCHVLQCHPVCKVVVISACRVTVCGDWLEIVCKISPTLGPGPGRQNTTRTRDNFLPRQTHSYDDMVSVKTKCIGIKFSSLLKQL